MLRNVLKQRADKTRERAQAARLLLKAREPRGILSAGSTT